MSEIHLKIMPYISSSKSKKAFSFS